jgi:hypothetical protein
MKVPVILFTYNRPAHTKATVEALQRNLLANETPLFLYSDAPANDEAAPGVQQVRDYLRTIRGFGSVEIIERRENFGLGNNIISGVTEVVEKYGSVIVLEDDLVTSPYFLLYMNEALSLYADNQSVVSIHGYVYPVSEPLPETFFLRGADCWGWATWKEKWQHFQKEGSVLLEALRQSGQSRDFDFQDAYPYTQMLEDQVNGKNASWAVRWYASAFLKDLYTLYPGRSLVFHAGSDGSGTNTGNESLLDVKLSDRPIKLERIEVAQNVAAYKAFETFLRKLTNPPLLFRIKRRLKKMMS